MHSPWFFFLFLQVICWRYPFMAPVSAVRSFYIIFFTDLDKEVSKVAFSFEILFHKLWIILLTSNPINFERKGPSLPRLIFTTFWWAGVCSWFWWSIVSYSRFTLRTSSRYGENQNIWRRVECIVMEKNWNHHSFPWCQFLIFFLRCPSTESPGLKQEECYDRQQMFICLFWMRLDYHCDYKNKM